MSKLSKLIVREITCEYLVSFHTKRLEEAKSLLNAAKKAATQTSHDCEIYRMSALEHNPDERMRLYFATRLVEASNSMVLAAEAVESANDQVAKTKARLTRCRQKIAEIIKPPQGQV